MKSCVEHRNLRHCGKEAAHFADACDVHGIVQRRERAERFDLRQHFVGDDSTLGEAFAAMHYPMGNDTYLARSADYTRVLRGESFEHYLERFTEAAFGQIALHLFRSAMHQARSVNADPFDLAARVV